MCFVTLDAMFNTTPSFFFFICKTYECGTCLLQLHFHLFLLNLSFSCYPLLNSATHHVSSEGESCPLDHSVMTRSEILSTGEDPLTSAMMSGNPRLALIDSPPSSPSPPQNADGSDSTITNDNPYRDAIPHNKHDSTYHAGEADEMPGRRPPSPIFRASCGVSPNGAFGAIFLNPLRALFQALVHGPALWFMNQNSHEATTKRPHDRRSLDEAVKFIRLVRSGGARLNLLLLLLHRHFHHEAS